MHLQSKYLNIFKLNGGKSTWKILQYFSTQ